MECPRKSDQWGPWRVLVFPSGGACLSALLPVRSPPSQSVSRPRSQLTVSRPPAAPRTSGFSHFTDSKTSLFWHVLKGELRVRALQSPPLIREQGPSAPSSPTSPGGSRLKRPSPLSVDAMQRINLVSLFLGDVFRERDLVPSPPASRSATLLCDCVPRQSRYPFYESE